MLVVVDGDALVHRTIAPALADPERPIDVVPCTTARGGLNACCALEPDCVLTELSLPDLDGLWLVSMLRQQPTIVGNVPIIMTSKHDEEEIRIRALRGGVDVFLGKPLQSAEAACQVRALIEMASRLRDNRGSIIPLEWLQAGRKRAIVGDLNRMSVATVLTALELERRSGDLLLKAGSAKLMLDLAEGMLVGGWRGQEALSPLAALRAAMHWPGRRFEFVPSDDRRVSSSAGGGTIGALVLQALRLDEAERDQAAPVAELEQESAEVIDPARWDQSVDPSVLANHAARPPLRARIRSGKVQRVLPHGGEAVPATDPVAEAPGAALVETVARGRRPDPRAEPLDLDLDFPDEPLPPEEAHLPEPAAPRKSGSPQSGTEWMDEASTLKMRIR